MRSENHLASLLEKLINERLSRADMIELSDCFKERSAPEAVNRYFLQIWNTPHHQINNPSNLLHQIHWKSGINISVRHTTKSKILPVRIIRYAAIFIFASGFSWFLNNQHLRQKNSMYAVLKRENEVEVAYGSRSLIKLSDGSVVKLNSGSKLTYPEVFDKDNRCVYLQGEAHFDVKSDASRPFYVTASEIVIKVTGTSFNVKSYPESNVIETILLSGSLEIFEKKQNGNSLDLSGEPLVLKPNQEAVYIRNPEKITHDDRMKYSIDAGTTVQPVLTMLEETDIHTRIAWNEDKLIFKNERFEDLAVRLERWFNVRITISSQELRNERFTGTFEKETIEQVLEALKIAESFEYTIVKNEIMIFKKLIDK